LNISGNKKYFWKLSSQPLLNPQLNLQHIGLPPELVYCKCKDISNWTAKFKTNSSKLWESILLFYRVYFVFVFRAVIIHHKRYYHRRMQIRCCAAPYSASRGPFDHFEIHVNSNLKVLTQISKWSNGPRAALHGAAQQRIHFLPWTSMVELNHALIAAIVLKWGHMAAYAVRLCLYLCGAMLSVYSTMPSVCIRIFNDVHYIIFFI
jgi:hypothetical protein